MDALPHLTSFDIGVLTISALLIGRGIWIGFIKQLASIVALLAGFVTAGRLHEDFYQAILPFVSNTSIAFIISYLFLFVAIYLGVILLGLGLKKVIDIALLGWFDQVLGGLIGAAKAIFIASLIFMILTNILSGSNNFLKRSACYPYLAISSEYILKLIRDADLRSSFAPKEPAIQDEKLPPVERKTEKIDPDQETVKESKASL
jgi:membrane protein required for colicin V production